MSSCNAAKATGRAHRVWQCGICAGSVHSGPGCLSDLLEETTVRMAGPRTVFGDAIGLGITLFERSEVDQRVIITYRATTPKSLPPVEAATSAHDTDVVVHVVGVGDPTTTGEEALDEAALQAVASTSGGTYFHANDREELEGIYTEIDQLDTREVESVSYRPRTDLYHWPLAAVLLIGITGQIITVRTQEDRDE